jgi:hypothetical protein
MDRFKNVMAGILKAGAPAIVCLVAAMLVDMGLKDCLLVAGAAGLGNLLGQFQRHPRITVAMLRGLMDR